MRLSWILRLFLLGAVVAGFLAPAWMGGPSAPSGAAASPRPAFFLSDTVWLDVQLAHPWSVEASRAFVDQYTGSSMVYGPCLSWAKRCIIVRERFVRSSWVAVTYPNWPRYGVSTVYVNPYDAWYSWYAKRSVIVHEFAHALPAITWHDQYCGQGVMYPSLYCDGHLRGLWFTPYQKEVLALY